MTCDPAAITDLEWLLRMTLMENITMTAPAPPSPGREPAPADGPHGYD